MTTSISRHPDRAAADRLLGLGFRHPLPGLGRIVTTDAGHAWVPAGGQV